MARVALEPDTEKMAKVGVEAYDVNRRLDHLLENREYRMEDISGLTVAGKDGASVRLAQVAQINVIFGRGGEKEQHRVGENLKR
jgi:hypothetical protein